MVGLINHEETKLTVIATFGDFTFYLKLDGPWWSSCSVSIGARVPGL